MTDDTCPTCGHLHDPEDTLQALFDALLTSLVREVVKPDMQASTLNVVRAFLNDQGVKADGKASLRDGLERVRARAKARREWKP